MTLTRESEPSSPGREIGGLEPSSTTRTSSSPLKFWSRIDLTARTTFSCRLKVGIMRESCGISNPALLRASYGLAQDPTVRPHGPIRRSTIRSPHRSINPHALHSIAIRVSSLSNGDRPGRAPGGGGYRCESPVETSEPATLLVAPDIAVDIAGAGTFNP